MACAVTATTGVGARPPEASKSRITRVAATGTVRGDLLWSLGARNVLDWAVEHPGGYDLLQESVPQRGRNLFAEVTYCH